MRCLYATVVWLVEYIIKLNFKCKPICVCDTGELCNICNMYEESPVSLFIYFFFELKWRIDVEDEKMWEWGQN